MKKLLATLVIFTAFGLTSGAASAATCDSVCASSRSLASCPVPACKRGRLSVNICDETGQIRKTIPCGRRGGGGITLIPDISIPTRDIDIPVGGGVVVPGGGGTFSHHGSDGSPLACALYCDSSIEFPNACSLAHMLETLPSFCSDGSFSGCSSSIALIANGVNIGRAACPVSQ